jgi:hypothetical protein
VSASESIEWSARLLEVLFDELYVTDALEDLLETRVRHLRKHQYPQAVALALMLRHSWRPDDLAWMRDQLRLPPTL